MDLLVLLIILLLVAAVFGGYGHTRNWGHYGWSPVGIILLILVILLLTGRLHV